MSGIQNCKIINSLHLQNGSTIAADLASVSDHENFYTYELVESIAKYLLERVSSRPKIGIICGSGMDLLGFSGPLADMLTDSVSFPYEKVPYFPQSTVPGHEGRLVFGMIKDIPVMCMQGRFHYYEGYPLWKCSMPVRVMKLIGITHLIVSNAAGGINPNFEAGDIMIIKDHVNLMGFAGNNPLQGVNDDRFGPRFIAMNKAYDVRLRKIAKSIAHDMGIEDFLHEGVYAVVGGPNFETVAELRMLQTCGVDAVGMSTVAEVLTGCHSGMTVFAFSLITNKCIMDYDSHEEANHTDVIEIGRKREPVVKEFVVRIVQSIARLQEENNISDNGC